MVKRWGEGRARSYRDSVTPDATATAAALAVLGDESRRRLLDFVRRARHPVTREEASAAGGVSRKLAPLHPGKLGGSGPLPGRPRGPRPRRGGPPPQGAQPRP